MLIARERAWQNINRKERNKNDEYEVKLFRITDISGHDFTVVSLRFEYAKSFAYFLTVLQDFTSLQTPGGYTLEHGPWKYQIGPNFDLKGSAGDWKDVKDEITYKQMLFEMAKHKSNSKMTIGIFHVGLIIPMRCRRTIELTT